MSVLMGVERLRQQAEKFQRRLDKELRPTMRALFEELHVRHADRWPMEDEWTNTISGDRLVRFAYRDLPEGLAFLTAQIAGHEVVYSIILKAAPFNRKSVERRFDQECPPISH
jgi:hypothetical protein